MKAERFLLQILIVLSFVGYAAEGYAYTLKGYIKYWDNRTGFSSDSGSLFTSNMTNRKLPFAHVEIWDYNGSCHDFNDPGCSETDDYRMTTVVADSNGYYEWNGLQLNKDPYLVFRYRTSAARVRTETGGEFVVAGPEILNVTGSRMLHGNATCWDLGSMSCPSDLFVTTNYAIEQHLSGILASAAAVEARWDYLGMSPYSPAYVYYPRSVTYGKCFDNSGQSWGYDKFCVTAGKDATLIAHELGHMIHRRELGYSGNLSGGTCPDNYRWQGPTPTAQFPLDPWGAANKCVVSEGWANFVAAATYWEPWSPSPKYAGQSSRELEGNTVAGNNGFSRRCVRDGSVNSIDKPERFIGNVTRFFWDLYDTTTVDDSTSSGFSDASSRSLDEMIWGLFPSGTGDREADESGENGRNVWDYSYWNNYYGLPSVTGLIMINCLEEQEI